MACFASYLPGSHCPKSAQIGDISSEVDEQSESKLDSVNRPVDSSTEQVLDTEAPFIKTNRMTEANTAPQIGNVTFFQMSLKSHYQSHLHLSTQGPDCPGGNGETSAAAGDDPPALFLHTYLLVTGGFVLK